MALTTIHRSGTLPTNLFPNGEAWLIVGSDGLDGPIVATLCSDREGRTMKIFHDARLGEADFSTTTGVLGIAPICCPTNYDMENSAVNRLKENFRVFYVLRFTEVME